MYSDILLEIAISKGLIKNKELAETEKLSKYINLKYDTHLHDADKIKDIDIAINIMRNAIKEQKKIAIYADYDCDGIPGATILSEFFDKINYNNYLVYIPHRHNEGYGIHIAAIDKLVEQGVVLMITIDLGITNVKEIAYAKERGIQVVLTDHHLPIRDEQGKQIIPNADAVVNMKRDDCKYTDKNLCGCATIWKVIKAFIKKYGDDFDIEQSWEKTLLDMVALSTVADMVPLIGENRALAHFGMKVLKISKRSGLNRILSNAKENKIKINEETIGFAIAPRLNSASRMDDPRIAFLTLSDKINGHMHADKLEMLNINRKAAVKDSMTEINDTHINDEIILITNSEWNPGILGLISSRVVEQQGRMTLVAGGRDDEGNYKGSVRSAHENENVVQVLSEVSDLLIHFGGHEAAGGFKVHESNIEMLRQKLNDIAKTKGLERESLYKMQDTSNKTQDTNNKLKNNFDIKLIHESINNNLYEEIKLLGPFGMGNAAPSICVNGTYKISFFGKRKEHMEIKYISLRAIKFFASNEDILNAEAGKMPIINLAWDSYRDDIVGRIIAFNAPFGELASGGTTMD